MDLTRAVKALLLICAGVYLVQVLMPQSLEYRMLSVFGLSVEGVMRGWWWQFVSYALLHGSILHLLLNMLGLFFLGPELERHMGSRAFVTMFVFCAVLGGLGWFVMTTPHEGVCVGASGGIFGLIGAFAGLFPHRQLTLLVFFVLPVTMPAWLLAVLFGLMQLGYLLTPGPSGIAYAAHLAGGLAGYLFVRVVYRGYEGRAVPVAMPWSRPVRPEGPSQAEIDAILDKITTQGIHALTPRERALLQQAGRRR